MHFKKILYLVPFTFIMSCSTPSNDGTPNENNGEVTFIESKESFALEQSAQKTNDSEKETALIGKKPEPFYNEELPATYTKRKFIKDLAALSYDIDYIPGNIVKFNPADSNYLFVTAKSILKKPGTPLVKSLTDEILYSNKINNKASFSASASIAGLKASGEQLLELIVQDVSKSIAPDSLIDVSALRKLIIQVPKDKRKNYFFVRSSLLTIVTNRKYSKGDFTAKVNASFVTAEGNVYSSREKFGKERVVSVDLVSFDDLLEQENLHLAEK